MPDSDSSPFYKRILLKLSGEALMGDKQFGVDPVVATQIAQDVADIQGQGVETAIVIGGGNIFRGLAASARGMDRATAQGLIGSYIHMGGKIGVLVEVNCETDFVARTDDFQNLVKEVAMHIAAADPKWVRREDVPAAAIEKEKAIYRAQMENTGKPAHVLDKIVEGKLGSFYAQFVLLDQPSIRDNNITIGQLVTQATAKTGENIQVGRFVRFRVGDTE